MNDKEMPSQGTTNGKSRILVIGMLLVCFGLGAVWFQNLQIRKDLAMMQNLVHNHSIGTDSLPYERTNSSGTVPHQHGPFHAASHAPRGEVTIVPEWNPSRTVAVALPKSHVERTGYIEVISDLMEACLAFEDIRFAVVLEQNNAQSRIVCDKIFQDRNIDRTRIEFFEVAGLDSIWLRDYGPIFIREKSTEQLYVVDAAYRDVRLGPDHVSVLFDSPSMLRAADDLVPIYFATYLNKPYIHPGFAINGGDIYADGQGTLYTSEETLSLNTGDRQYVADVCEEYFGIHEVRYLRSLPGPTVKHIDMFFKLATPNCCLVGEYDGSAGEDDLDCLQKAAAKVLNENTKRLEDFGLRVIRVPMPDITKMSKWEFYGKIFDDTERDRHLESLANSSEHTLKVTKSRIQSEFLYLYRTYLNSVLLVNENDEKLVVVPEYLTRGERHTSRTRISEAYRAGFGDGVKVVFVNAEPIAHSNGSLRCIVCTVPN